MDDGAKLLSFPLFALPGEMGLKFTLYYHSRTGSAEDIINPWASSIDDLLDTNCVATASTSCDQVTLYRPDGSSLSFSGNYAAYGNFPEIGGGGLATLTHNSDGTWTLHDEDATVQTYDSAGHATSIKDTSGIGWTITHSSTKDSGVTTATTTVTHTDGQFMTIVSVGTHTTTTASRQVTVTDPAGNRYTYTEDGYKSSNGMWVYNVNSISFPGTPATGIGITRNGDIVTGIAYNGTPYWSTSYDGSLRVISDGAADGTERTSIVYSTSSGGMVATITNPLGLTTANTYTTDSQGNYLLSKVSNSAVQGCGATTNTLAWDGNDNPTRTVDNDGTTHTYSYAADGQLQTETEAYGTSVARKTDYAWDPNKQLNRLLSVTVEGESKTSYTYNAQNRLASVTRTNLAGVGMANQPLTTTYAYTLYGDGIVEKLVVTQPSPSGTDHTTYAYDTHGNLTSMTDGLGHVTAYSNYNGLGEVGKVVGPNGDETDYTYDARGRVATKTTHPNGATATWAYAYDGFGLLSQVSAPDGEVTTWSRDAEKRVKTITHNDKDGVSTETFTYDANGDVTSDVVARGSDIGKSTTYVYNALGKVYQVKGSHGQVLTYAYDGNGNVLSVTDALGHKTSYVYDALNRVIGVTNAAGGVMSYAYDAGDHMTAVEDPRGLVTTYSYDGFGQLWEQVSPDTGTTTFNHDTNGRLTSKHRADGTTLAYSYDALNRLTKVTTGGQAQTFTWDACTGGKGRLCKVADAHSTVSYTYSPEGWVTGRHFAITGAASYSLGYNYDNMGHLAALIYPDGNQAIYDYSHGAASAVRIKIGSGTYYAASSVGYRPMDLAMSGWTSYNGVVNSIAYDSDLRPTSITASGAESLAFSFDAANRITKITNGLHGSQTEALGYDALGRVTDIQFPSTGSDVRYAYDANGNRTRKTYNGAVTNFSYASGSNYLLGASDGTSYGYDADGNTVTVDGHTAYSYGPFNHLVNAAGYAYTYSAAGRRVEKAGASGTTYFAPGAGRLLAEDLNNIWRDYVYLDGRLVSVTAHGDLYSVHDDQTGRPLAITATNSHTVIWEAAGQPFSSYVTVNNWGTLNLGFPGQYHDSESGLWHNGQRDYDASMGRYIESDPIGLAGGVNTYAYVGNNP
ncbi:MAG TPA: RHS repeat-associated core domain-containing protein, partial [Rhodanobacteraceae bacterium]|nr:RHS repeat-associated core domain-containing protein [Rhodanobacteraceae bacterium]